LPNPQKANPQMNNMYNNNPNFAQNPPQFVNKNVNTFKPQLNNQTVPYNNTNQANPLPVAQFYNSINFNQNFNYNTCNYSNNNQVTMNPGPTYHSNPNTNTATAAVSSGKQVSIDVKEITKKLNINADEFTPKGKKEIKQEEYSKFDFYHNQLQMSQKSLNNQK